jgi:hypothetical protein
MISSFNKDKKNLSICKYVIKTFRNSFGCLNNKSKINFVIQFILLFLHC